MKSTIRTFLASFALLTGSHAAAEPMFSVQQEQESQEQQPAIDHQINAMDMPGAVLAPVAAQPNELPGAVLAPVAAQPNELPESKSQTLTINRNAYLGQLQRLGWRDYGVATAVESPSIMLAGGEEIKLEDEELVATGDDDAVIVATAAGAETESLFFISNDAIIGGELFANGKYYDVRPGDPDPDTEDVSLTFTEVDEWSFRDEAATYPVDIVEASSEDEGAVVSAAEGSNDILGPGDVVTKIDVLVIYPRSLEDLVSGGAVGNEIKLAVQYVNYSYIRSGINQQVNLVHFEPVEYEESGSIDTDLKRLANDNDGYLDSVFDLWKEKEADIVSLWVGESDYPGVAYTLKDVDVRFAPCAVNVVRWPDAIKNFSFAHELGHNMGARHDIQATGENLPYAHAHGFVDQRLVSVMAYPVSSCDYRRCKRVPSFSNADDQFGILSSADNRLTLNKTAPIVSKFDSQHHLLGSCRL